MFKQIDDMAGFVKGLQEKGMPSGFYAKYARINATQGKIGQEVVTKMANGLEETRNAVTADEKTGEAGWIVTNPSGEQYIVADSQFKKKYELDKETGMYKPTGGPVKAVETDESISFKAPWGSDMNIENGGYLIANAPNDIYGIQRKEFFETYAECDKNGIFKDPALREKLGQKLKATVQGGPEDNR